MQALEHTKQNTTQQKGNNISLERELESVRSSAFLLACNPTIANLAPRIIAFSLHAATLLRILRLFCRRISF
jgi:hypothetical protein